jgi:Leucine-rich repeat (LRR) protein
MNKTTFRIPVVHLTSRSFHSVAEPLCSVPQCSCSGNTVFCDSASLATLPRAPSSSATRPARALFLAHNQLRITADTFLKFHWLIRLVLTHNGLTSLPARAFLGLQNLHELNLSHNAISQFRPGTFEGLVSLRILDISHNALSHLDRSALAELSRMELLIMEHNPLLRDIAEDTFDGLDALRTLNTDAFKFCCVASAVETCTPAADEFSK